MLPKVLFFSKSHQIPTSFLFVQSLSISHNSIALAAQQISSFLLNIISNALTWRELQGGNHMLEDLRKIKTHDGMVLSMFSSQDNVGQSPIIATLSKRLELDREQKSKYAVVWNLQMLLDYVRRTGLGSGRQLMRSTMALVVAFSGCRMTELAQMRRSDIIQDAFRTV
ncbi:MAG: hypothetical protein EZS28_044281, partial [Streblomastix strix]